MIEPTQAEKDERRAAIVALERTQKPDTAVGDNGIPTINTGPGTDPEGGDYIRYIPSALESAGIPVPALIVREYEMATGLTWHPGDKSPSLVTLDSGVRVYAHLGK